ncbi:Crp/Fnr family transcriptional regulator [Sinimarinibacterium sp. CAU 1509]|uniref:Crp/Fnr family transcriptional regulator n=1 Tax=Sinimarinibacterium sp. CAU 1509 TaxID=2562283 RepID=UPI0010AD1228|nr:Crp/Fnr family transcriptional regulator [Sinimarinibacterium sp. CAU 1509]TJY61017.1 Crp/Fnr family transcriptional regulator [Sinimarinibacterium sp. CAU 1509]
MTLLHSPNQNHLLAALPEAEFERLLPDLELVPMRLGDLLSESGEPAQHAWFPTTAIVSLQYMLESGDSSEIASVGHEGLLGVSLFLGGKTTLSRAIVQTAGHGYRLRAKPLMTEFDRAGMLMRLLLRYTHALMAQMSLTGACARHHSLSQQLCRWLLTTLDRMPSNDLAMTQELIAGMLGVRREGVTEAAGNLRDLGAISYRRGHITVLDRALLNTQVCECYAVIKKENARLLCDVKHRQDAVGGVK